jgi:hypothetical protein
VMCAACRPVAMSGSASGARARPVVEVRSMTSLPAFDLAAAHTA